LPPGCALSKANPPSARMIRLLRQGRDAGLRTRSESRGAPCWRRHGRPSRRPRTQRILCTMGCRRYCSPCPWGVRVSRNTYQAPLAGLASSSALWGRLDGSPGVLSAGAGRGFRYTAGPLLRPTGALRAEAGDVWNSEPSSKPVRGAVGNTSANSTASLFHLFAMSYRNLRHGRLVIGPTRSLAPKASSENSSVHSF
jgi:hypothetical protein